MRDIDTKDIKKYLTYICNTDLRLMTSLNKVVALTIGSIPLISSFMMIILIAIVTPHWWIVFLFLGYMSFSLFLDFLDKFNYAIGSKALDKLEAQQRQKTIRFQKDTNLEVY